MTVRLIGDVHGVRRAYLKKIRNVTHSIQLGDLDFNYPFLRNVDGKCHKVIPGNHDNYDAISDYEHFYPRYGMEQLGDLYFFYLRGAFSIDWYDRVHQERIGKPKEWWMDEELNLVQLRSAIGAFEEHKPDIVLTHDCPLSISKNINDGSVLERYGYNKDTFQTYTGACLQAMFERHQPYLWVFGHYHTSYKIKVGRCEFVCLNILEHIDI